MQLKATILNKAIEYLGNVVKNQLKQQPNKDTSLPDWKELPLPDLDGILKPIHDILHLPKMSKEELVVFLIAAVPHLKPNFFDDLIAEFIPNGGEFPQIGGIRGKQHRGFLPTGETALYILAGEDMGQRFHIRKIFNNDHFFQRQKLLWVEETVDSDPFMSGKIVISPEVIDLIVHNEIIQPRFGLNFPAQRLETDLKWVDIVLNPNTDRQISELKLWLDHNDVLLHKHGMKNKLKPGYRVLFHGPPGTGKTLTANLLGKRCNRDIYKIDLSLVVSKYIGETEKNLSRLFDKAENKNWILFFDEADALFGKRTQIKDSHDRYANQEISYLLQRVEMFDGLVILASNLKENIDNAFIRRFQAIIYFPMPTVDEKMKIWKQAFPKDFKKPDDGELRKICQKYKLSGASIMNIIQYCSLLSLGKGEKKIKIDNIHEGIRKEFIKEGQTS